MQPDKKEVFDTQKATEALRALGELFIAVNEHFKGFGEPLKAVNEHFKAFNETLKYFFETLKNKTKPSYKNAKKAFKYYAKDAGLIMPDDLDEFLVWFFEVKNPHLDNMTPKELLNNMPKITKKDFIDFDKYYRRVELGQKVEDKPLSPQQTDKKKPELNKALISFSNPKIIDKLHNELKGYFQGNEAELKKALKGEQLNEYLLFPHNQNKFVEVFKRLKYNGFLLSTPKEIKDWICSTFTYQYQKGDKKEVRNFNASTVHDILTKNKGEPPKKGRICNVDWLPYKSHLTRQREAEKENT